MSPFNTARKAMLDLLGLFPGPDHGQPPTPVRMLLLDIDSYLETLPALEITQRDEALIAARATVRESRLLLKIAELHETIADMKCAQAARVTIDPRYGTDDAPNVGEFAQQVYVIPDGFKLDVKRTGTATYSEYRNAGWFDPELIRNGFLIPVSVKA